MDIYQDLKQAVDYHRAGQLDRAREAYIRLNRHAPQHPDPLHLMGVIAYQAGEYRSAAELIQRAIDIDSTNPAYHNNLGNAYKEMGLIDEAVDCYQQAIELNPDYADAYFDLGNACQEIGQLNEAVCAYQAALNINPLMTEAHINLGIGHSRQGHFDQAIVHLKKALELKPDDIDIHINIGNAFKAKSQFLEAIDWYRRAIDGDPASCEAHAQMGHALQQLGRLNEAGRCYQTALSINPNRGDLCNCWGTIHLELGRLGEAAGCFRQSLSLSPRDPQAQCNLGIVYRKQARLADAISSYHKAIELEPNFVTAHYNLGNAYGRLGEAKLAIDCYRRVLELDPDHTHALSLLVRQLQQICAWEDLQEPLEMLKFQTRTALRQRHKSPEMPFLTVSLSEDAGRCLEVARLWAERISARATAHTDAGSGGPSILFGPGSRNKPLGRLTIGYLSADFRNHATAHLMRSLFRNHSRRSFNINCYSYGRNDNSEYRRQIEADCDRFVELRSVGDVEAARAIREDGVDILLDLKGYTEGNRLGICACRPAPIQVSYLGFPGTSGADFFDYIITDRIVSPPNHARYYTEKLVYMPHCYQVNDIHQPIADRDYERSDFDLPEAGFVFCSFNEPYKIEALMFDVWMDLLQQTPDSVLWLLYKSDLAATNLRAEASRRGIAPERLIFAEKLPKAEHLARLKLADLYLDTRIYNGHTTISDALWAGVPGVTVQGGHFASRVAASILTSAGLPELVTGNLSDYRTLALRLATHPDLLRTITEKLECNRLNAPLFDTTRFVCQLENAYAQMWRIYAAGEVPRQIEVAAD